MTATESDRAIAMEFLRDEFDHLATSFLSNEDQGERRVNVFLGLVASISVASGLAVEALEPTSFDVRWIIAAATVLLIPVGWMTLTRLARRNLVTTEYLCKMRKIRTFFADLDPEIAGHLPYPPTGRAPERRRESRYGIEHGGLVEIVAFANCGLAVVSVILIVAAGGAPGWWIVLPAGLALVLLWIGQLEWVCRIYRKGQEDLVGSPCPASRWRIERRSDTFRANVGLVVLNTQDRVLAMERTDVRGAWQLPQGGVRKGETLEEAAYREAEEEIGFTKRELRLVAEYPGWLTYELPPGMRGRRTGRGQVQKWFIFRLDDSRRSPTANNKEVRDFRWMGLRELTRQAIHFRKPTYRALTNWLEHESAIHTSKDDQALT